MTRAAAWQPHDRSMQLSATLAWLVDAAGETPGPDLLLAELGARLIEDGLPLAGGALTLAFPHPLIARRTWLWRADSGEVIEALGFAPGDPRRRRKQARRTTPVGAGSPDSPPAPCMKTLSGPDRTGPRSAGSGRVSSRLDETDRLRQAARFAAAPLAALAARATLTAALEAYLGRRSAARVLAGSVAARRRRDDRGGAALRRSARLHGALRKHSARRGHLGSRRLVRPHRRRRARLRRRSAQIHGRRRAGDLPGRRGVAAQRLRRGAAGGGRRAYRNGASRRRRDSGRGCRPCPSAPRCIWARCCGAISAPPIGWISPRSALPSIWSAGWRGYAGRSTRRSSSRAPCRRDGNAADPARNACAARDHVSLRGVHLARELSRREPGGVHRFPPPRAMGHTTPIVKSGAECPEARSPLLPEITNAACLVGLREYRNRRQRNIAVCTRWQEAPAVYGIRTRISPIASSIKGA